MMKIAKWIAGAVLMSAFAAQASIKAPDELVRETANDVLAIVKADKDLQSGDQKKVVELVEAKVLPHFDFSRMTRLAMAKNWNTASDAQKETLTKEFRTLLVRTYSSSLSQYRNQTLEVKPAKVAAEDTQVTVKSNIIQPGGQPIPIDYRMAKGDSGWKVFDISVEGASLVTTYRGEFANTVEKSGVDGLIKLLADKNQSAGKK